MEEGRAASAANGPANAPVFAALDLGTNNCRLLIAATDDAATRSARGYLRVLDSYSRIVRLGEGVSITGELSVEAMDRTLVALGHCRKKVERYPHRRARFVATEACRRARNGAAFLQRVKAEMGMEIDIISNQEEARLAFLGCASLLAPHVPYAVVFDIGGGSTELMWVETASSNILDWVSIPLGVMNLPDRFGGHGFAEVAFTDMVQHFTDQLTAFEEKNQIRDIGADAPLQLLSTSGTVTTLAAIHLKLPRYDRTKIDGITLPTEALQETTQNLIEMRPSERFHHPCIGPDRSDFIISGCAIFEAISRLFPSPSITIADRGVREGIILSLMHSMQS